MAEVIPTTQARRLAAAYLAVFGPPDKRSSDQAMVMADLESHCFAFRLVSEARGPQDGELCANRALFNDGRRSVWLRIRGQLLRALAVPKPPRISRKQQPPTST